MKHVHSHIPLLIFAFIIMIFLAALYGYIHYRTGELLIEAADMRDQASVSQLSVGREADVIKLYESNSDDWARLPTFFVSANEPLSFIETLENLGKMASSTVAISSINTTPGTSKTSVKSGSVSAHIEAEGSWQAVVRTLKFAEVMPFEVTIDHVRFDALAPTSASSTKHNWHLSFDVKALTLAGSTTPSK